MIFLQKEKSMEDKDLEALEEQISARKQELATRNIVTDVKGEIDKQYDQEKKDIIDADLKKAEQVDASKFEIVNAGQGRELTKDNFIEESIVEAARKITDIKQAIDLASTAKALEKQTTVIKLVDEKTDELIKDAEAKKIKAETDKIKEEVGKVRAQAEKELEELSKAKKRLEAEVEELKAQDDKAKAFFESNKSVLKTIGIREKLSLSAMQVLMIPAASVFILFQIILLPFSLIGFAIEQIMNIVDAVCGKVAKGGLKIILSILVVITVLGLVFGIYWLITNNILGF